MDNNNNNMENNSSQQPGNTPSGGNAMPENATSGNGAMSGNTNPGGSAMPENNTSPGGSTMPGNVNPGGSVMPENTTFGGSAMPENTTSGNGAMPENANPGGSTMSGNTPPSGSTMFGNTTPGGSATSGSTPSGASPMSGSTPPNAGPMPGSIPPGFQWRPERVQEEIRRTRHQYERPLYVAVIVLGAIGLLISIIYFVAGGGIMGSMKAFFGEMNILGLMIISGFMIAILSVLGVIGSILFMCLAYLFGVYSYYGDEMSYSIRVSEKNFPEIYEKVREYTWLLGLKKEPEVYVQQMNGSLNAYTVWVPGKTFIHLNSEIVDIAYMENKDFDTVFFVMAHEFGHIHLNHVQLYYNLWTMLVNSIPLLGNAVFSNLLSRAREYSADRVAQALTDGKNQVECMMLLGAGRHLYKYTDSIDYMQKIMGRYNPVERFARWCINLLSSHPIMPFRTAAILDPEKKSGRLI